MKNLFVVMLNCQRAILVTILLVTGIFIAGLVTVPTVLASGQATSSTVVDDIVTDPEGSGDFKVIALIQDDTGETYAVVTENFLLIYTTVEVNDTLPDPDSGVDWTVESVNTDGVTGLVDELNLTRITGQDADGNDIVETKSLLVVEDKSADASAEEDAAAGAAGDPGGAV
ncbi:MAG: hypothetical protein KAU27_11740, partial [Desulfuromonadales bacterium]|nr:hypothetical protein [Desulfuromonadales bacterium]